MAERNLRKEKTGIVVSDKMDKTVVVKVSRQITHPKFGKIIHLQKKYIAHDEKDECSKGDVVHIVETRPISKTKRWRVDSIVTKVK
jgi:small subunit ribosomal protein S17